MRVGRDVAGDLGEMQVHGLGVDLRQHESGGFLGLGAGGSEEVGRLVALIAGLPRPAAAARPLSGQLALLADPGFVLEPDLDPLPRRFLADGGNDQLGQFFLNSACASGADLGCCGRAEIRLKPSAGTSLPMPRSW